MGCQVPPGEPGNGFDWSVDRADANRTAGDVTCCSAGTIMLVLYFAYETPSIDVDAGVFPGQTNARQSVPGLRLQRE